MKQNHDKLNKAVSELKQIGLDGLIVYSNGTCNILGPKYLLYFAEFRPMGPNSAAVLAKNGEVILLVEPEWDTARVQRQSWIKDVRGTSDFVLSLANIMDKLQIKGKVGVVASDEMNSSIFKGIEQETEIELADSIISIMAEEKNSTEIEAARRAGRIADIGFEAMLGHIQVGVTEYELLAEIEVAMRLAGADDIFNFMSSGRDNYAMHNPTDRILSKGDIIIAEITAACGGQFVQLCRTVTLGKPDPVLIEKYEMLLSALSESLSHVKPGKPAGDISRAINKVISDAGYEKYCYPPYMRARGHGIGIGSIAPGAAIDDDTQGILKSGQVLVIHPNQFLPETGYLACGETVLVTKAGFERLSETETRLYVKKA